MHVADLDLVRCGYRVLLMRCGICGPFKDRVCTQASAVVKGAGMLKAPDVVACSLRAYTLMNSKGMHIPL